MSRGKNLQEMETGTAQSRTAVNANAKAAEPMQKLTTGIAPGQTGSWEDLGGPTPENYRSDDDSAKLITPTGTLKSVKNVVTKGAKSAEAMQKMKEAIEALEEDEELIESSKKDEESEDEESEDDESEDDESEDDEEEDKKKKKKKVEESINIEEDVAALLAGEDLSEEFREKAKLIFETAINAKISEIYESLEEHYESKLLEEVDSMKGQLVERVDAYLEYVADEWLQENALVVEQGLKTEMTESFLQGMKGLFEDHYVTIPDDKYNVLESMVDKLDEMETKLNEQIEKNVALNRRLAESVTDVVFAEVSEGLALSQKDKLASLAENVEFDGEDNYREKLANLRESYFPSKAASAQRTVSENLSEEVDYSNNPVVEGVMGRYLQTLQRVSKK